MILGIGLDLCEIARMEKLLQDDRFLHRYFTPDEIEYVRSRGVGAARSLAGLFAAQITNVKPYTKILKKCIIPIIILLVYAGFVLVKSKLFAWSVFG